jgi:uncharacterized RDD family membrane protein YckC
VTTPTPPAVPAGWYQDPEDASAQRLWDGTAWTDHRRSVEPPTVAPVVDPPPGPQGAQWPTAAPTASTPSSSASSPPAPHSAFGYGYGQSGAGVVPAGMYFDQMSGLVLPEGVQLASVGRRIGAFFLAIPLSVITLGIGYVIWGLLIWGRGQTPALQVLGMRCWRPETKQNAGFWYMALREVIGRIADQILSIITLLISFILFATGKERKSLHDHIAGTVVLLDPNKVLAT